MILDPAQLEITFLAPLVAVALLFAVRTQLVAARARRSLAALGHERMDPSTLLLPQTAIPLRLEPELAWAEYERKPVGIVVFQVFGSRPEHAARALRKAMRTEENGYLLSANRFVLGLWDTAEAGVGVAVQRLGGAMLAAGHDVVDAGVAMFPRDGVELEHLVEVAAQHLRPLDQQELLAEESAPRVARSLGSRFVRLVTATLPNLILAGVFWASTYLVYPAPRTTDSEPLVALGTSGVLAAAAALVLWANLNRGAGREPRSAGLSRLEWWHTLVVWLVGWVALAPYMLDRSNAWAAVAAISFHAAVWILVLLEGRYWVRGGTLYLGLVLVFAAVLLGATWEESPLIANTARLVVAMSLGAALAAAMERLWWVLVVAGAIAAVDAWSVFSESGTTSQLVTSDSKVLDVLFFTGPPLDGPSLYDLGTTDLVFVSLFIAFVHLWRLPVLRTAVALVLGVSAAFATGHYMRESVSVMPVLPFLSAAFLIANAGVLVHELKVSRATSIDARTTKRTAVSA